ncbi:hypothetical protein TRFO_37136 [Tritrichomonas foetus]|uniref:Uncharacterized protein n=1 Tax=Tritrichomonas foetus TaxID=1144522 RepID=A0A1J4JBW7_9EUKA|nr:hypothetical protein TRFO_37136 [Tritrichomonas foetus]|eukprot:OHS96640.1 hypothetical protein TRFO_37136 [Tritrichomonas foetus]
MGYLVQKDELFKILYEAQEGKIDAPPQKICATLGSFRKNLSLAWLNKIKKHEPKNCLTTCIITILKYTENQDASVRVIAYGTLGAMLLCVATFDPTLFIHAFGNAVSQIPVSPRSSMAIINMFVYLSRFVSSVQLQEFIIVVPVVNHFNADISDFLKYLPQIIPLMKDLPKSFHQCILKTLLQSSSKRLNSSFTGAIMSLLSLNKPLMVSYLKKLIIESNMQSAIISLGPTLIGDREVYELLEEDGRELFLSTALNEFIREPPGFMEFEASCLTCSHFLRYAKNTDKYESLHNRIFNHLKKEYPPHFRRLRMLLPMSLDDILKVKEDTDSMKAAQIFALASFYVDNYSKTDADQVAQFLLSFKFSRNDLYCSLIESFTKCISLFLVNCKERYHIRLLKWILKKTNINWVHDMAVANLLCAIDCSLCCKTIPEFFQLAIQRLLEFSLSPNNRLFTASIAAIQQIVSYDTLHELLSTIIRSDWIDEFNVARRFELLYMLASIFQSEEYQIFVPIAFECLLFFGTTNVVTHVCNFLSKVEVKSIPSKVRRFCFNFVASNFESFTQTPMNVPVPGYKIPEPSPNFLDTIDTDIVTNPAFDHETSLAPIRNCFHFMCTLPLSVLKDTDVFFWFCIDLIPLFGQEALEKAFQIQEFKPVDEEILWKVLFKTFETTSKDSVTATCCKLLSRSLRAIPPNVDVMVEKYLIEQKSKDPDLLYYVFVLVDQLQHDKAIQSVPTMVSGLEQKIASVLLFKLVLVIGREMVNTIDDKYAIALVQFANFYDGEYTEKVLKYLNSTPFCEWPLDDPGMNTELLTFLSKNDIKQKVGDFTNLDQQHLSFLVNHQEVFELSKFKEFIEQNPSKFSKIDTTPFYKKNLIDPSFKLQPVNETILCSASHILKCGVIISSKGLLDSFFQFSTVKISEEHFNTIFTKTIKTQETYKYAIQYAIRNNIKINLNFILEHEEFFENDEIFTTLISYLRIYSQILNKTQTQSKAKNEKNYKSNRDGGSKASESSHFCNFDARLVEKIETKLERKIDPRMIIGSKWRSSLKQLVLINPNYFLKFYIEQSEFKGVHFRSLIKLLYECDFDPVILHEIISIHLSVFSGFESVKKKSLLLRFIAVTIDSLLKKNKKVEAELIIGFFAASLDMIIESPFPAIHEELSILFKVIIPVAQNAHVFSQVIEKFVNETHFSITYLKSMTFLFNFHQKQIINSQLFIPLFESEIPSFSKIAISCLNDIVVSEAPPLSIQIIMECSMCIIKIMALLAINYSTPELTVSLTKSLLTNKQIFQIDQLFFDNFMITFLTNSQLPAFSDAIEIIPHIVDFYPKSVEILFELTFYHEKISRLLLEIFRSRVQNSPAQKAINDRICTFFTAHPNLSLCKILPETAIHSKSVESTICFLMNYLLHLEDQFLPFFLTLSKFIPIYPSLIESFSDIFNLLKPKSRSLSLILATSSSKDDVAKSIFYAASETNEIDRIENELSLFLSQHIE